MSVSFRYKRGGVVLINASYKAEKREAKKQLDIPGGWYVARARAHLVYGIDNSKSVPLVKMHDSYVLCTQNNSVRMACV
jgi:hypothetical protein